MTCSPEATTASYSRASCSGAACAAPGDQLVGRAGHGRDHDGDLVAGVDLALDVARHVADAVDVGDRGSAEFHHQASHDVSATSSDATSGRRDCAASAGREKARIHTGGVARAATAAPGEPCESSRWLSRRAAAHEHRRSGRGRALFARSPPNGGTRAARWRRCTSSIRCGSAISATRRPRASAATPSGSTASRACACSISAAAAASCPSRWRGSAPQMVGVDPSEDQYRGGAARMPQRERARDRLPRHHRRGAGRCRRALRRRAGDGGGRARRRRRRCSCDAAPTMVKPGGLMIAATLNRTLKSFALAIVGAEYVLRWLPRGTHQWDKFVTPNELEIALEQRRAARDRRARRDLQSARRPLAAVVRHGRQLHAGRANDEMKERAHMILELVEFNSPKGWTPPAGGRRRAPRHPEMAGQPGTAAQAFPARARTARPAPASTSGRRSKRRRRAHDEEWRQSVIKRTGGGADHPLFRPVPADRQREGHGHEFPRPRD